MEQNFYRNQLVLMPLNISFLLNYYRCSRRLYGEWVYCCLWCLYTGDFRMNFKEMFLCHELIEIVILTHGFESFILYVQVNNKKALILTQFMKIFDGFALFVTVAFKNLFIVTLCLLSVLEFSSFSFFYIWKKNGKMPTQHNSICLTNIKRKVCLQGVLLLLYSMDLFTSTSSQQHNRRWWRLKL